MVDNGPMSARVRHIYVRALEEARRDRDEQLLWRLANQDKTRAGAEREIMEAMEDDDGA